MPLFPASIVIYFVFYYRIYFSLQMSLAANLMISQHLSCLMGKEVHPDIKRAAVRLAQHFSIETTAEFLDINSHTVRRAIQLHSETGDVVKEKTGIKRGRRPILESSHKEV
jgi:predicted transcriptional regulator